MNIATQLQPLGTRVLLRRAEPEIKTNSGILLPGISQERPREARVVAIGLDVTRVSVGDTVLTTKFGGVNVDNEGEFVLFEEVDIMGVIRNPSGEDDPVVKVEIPVTAEGKVVASDDDFDEPLPPRTALCDGEVCESCQ